MGRRVEDLATRFERLVDRTGEHHLWLGSVNPDRGTGRIKVDKVEMTAHRVAWELVHGYDEAPEGLRIEAEEAQGGAGALAVPA